MVQITMQKLRALGQLGDISLFRRLNWLTQSMFNGKRNLYQVFGYTSNPEYDQRFFKYLRQDVAGRIVDAPAAALWTQPPLVTSTNPEWNSLWDDLIARWNLYSNIERCDKLAGIGRFSVLLIGFNDGAPLDTPVNTRAITQKGEKILFLQPYSERTVTIKRYNDNNRSEDFMKPELYTISPMSEYVIGWNGRVVNKNTGPASHSTFDVHASRVVHIAENILENSVYGSPRLERVYNTLDDLLKITGGSAETFWLTANRGLHIDIDKEMELLGDDEDALAAEIDEYQHQQRRVIRTRGTKITSLGSDTPDPTGVFKMLIAVLSGATGIPQRVLIGSEAGQLASEQDRANWADRIDERRASWGNPYVLFPTIKKLVRSGYLPSDPNIEITVDWPNAFKMSPLENAQTSAQHARSATNFAKAIETMENLKRGEPGTPDSVDPETGAKTPGTPAVPGIDLPDLVTVDEARKMMWLDKPAVTFDSGEDVGSSGSGRARMNQADLRTHQRRVQITQGRIMRVF
jgi:hypothetical protein